MPPFNRGKPPKPIRDWSWARPVVRVAVAVVALAVIAGGVWYFLLRSTPEKTVRRFMAATERQNRAALKAWLTTESQAMVALEPELATKLPLPTDGVLGAPNIEGNRATVPMTVTVAGASGVAGFTGFMRFQWNWLLVKEGGRWRVDLKSTVQAIMTNIGEAEAAGEAGGLTPPAPTQ